MHAADYFAVQNLLNRYFQYVDAGDFDTCGELFARADLIYTQSGETFSQNPKGIADKMRSFVRLYGEAQTPLTRHHSGNIIIESAGENIANSACSAIIYQATPDFAFQAIGEAGYRDNFEKQDGHWVFTRREMSLNFTGDLRHHLLTKVST